MTLTRKDTRIVVTLKALYADGARFIGNNPNCQKGARQTLLYGPSPGYVDTRVGNDTELRSNVALVVTPEGGTGGGGTPTSGQPTSGTAAVGTPSSGQPTAGEGSGGPAGGGGPTPGSPTPGSPTAGSPTASAAENQTLELYNGTITLDRPGCIASEKRDSKPSVTLLQGRTTVEGTRFFLDQGSDTGTMDGPIQLKRAAAGDSPSLTATADRMRFDTQSHQATLLGNVRVTSQDRVTTADSLQLDEAAGIAVLEGSPARSTKGNDVLEGSRLRYYLNNNDVVVLGKVHGNLDVQIP